MLINTNISLETDVVVPVAGHDRPNEMRKSLEALKVFEPTEMYLYVDGQSILQRMITKMCLKHKDCLAR